MKQKNLTTQEYLDDLTKKTSKIASKAKARKIRRIVILVIFILTCVIGIIFGITNKKEYIEKQYIEYCNTNDNSLLTKELLSYKDIYTLFEHKYLGNDNSQILMGGFFYNRDNISIYPDNTVTKMILTYDDQEVVLCEGLASDINVANNMVYYKKLNSNEISAYDVKTKVTSILPLENVGEFIIFDNKAYYIDMNNSSLMLWDFELNTFEEIVESGVYSFAIVGNYILFLTVEHNLFEIDLDGNNKTSIASNVTSFSFNEEIWIQNNEKLYKESFDKQFMQEVNLDFSCKRLLGVTDDKVYFESADGIYALYKDTSEYKKVENYIFVGASNDKVFAYRLKDSTYHILKTE